MAKRLYVAYGSNLNMEQMMRRCPHAHPIGTSKIAGYELLFKGSKTGSYLTIEEQDGAEVPVGVWEVDGQDEQALDWYEGYPTFYYKTEMVLPIKSFKTGKISHRRAFVYIMHEERELGIPSQYYVDTCVKGYYDFGFNDLDPLRDALDKSKEALGYAIMA